MKINVTYIESEDIFVQDFLNKNKLTWRPF